MIDLRVSLLILIYFGLLEFVNSIEVSYQTWESENA